MSVNRKVTVPVGGPAICVASSLPLKKHYTTTVGTGMLSKQTSNLPKASARSRSILIWSIGWLVSPDSCAATVQQPG
jgi:hypothetical protein